MSVPVAPSVIPAVPLVDFDAKMLPDAPREMEATPEADEMRPPTPERSNVIDAVPLVFLPIEPAPDAPMVSAMALTPDTAPPFFGCTHAETSLHTQD